jgi:hypothetical protein
MWDQYGFHKKRWDTCMWDWYRFHKKRTRTHYAKLVFFHPVGYASHIVHYGASGMRNIDPLFFILV